MKKLIVFLLLLLFSVPVLAAPCVTLPKAGLTAQDVQISATNNGSKLYFAWPTTDPAIGCCVRIPVSVIQSSLVPDFDKKLSEFIATSGANLPAQTEEEKAHCRTIIAKVSPTGPAVVRNTIRADGARPLKQLRDPSQPYSATNLLIDFKPTAYVEAGRPCERTTVVNITAVGQWLYVTNLAGVRGIALCK